MIGKMEIGKKRGMAEPIICGCVGRSNSVDHGCVVPVKGQDCADHAIKK